MKKRIISLAPSTTAILCAIGAKDQVVGVSKHCKDLSDVAELPQLGDFWSATSEEVNLLKPDLIIGALPYKSEIVQKLIYTGIPFFLTHPKSFEQIYLDIEWLGKLTGYEDNAEKLVLWMKQEIDEIKNRLKNISHRPRIYCEEWMKPLINSISWVKEMVEIAGGTFVPEKPSSTLEPEEVIRINPEIIMISWCGVGLKANPKIVTSRSGWDQIDAVRNNKVYVAADQYFNSPCQYLITGIKLTAQILHPEIFGAYRLIDELAQEVKAV